MYKKEIKFQFNENKILVYYIFNHQMQKELNKRKTYRQRIWHFKYVKIEMQAAPMVKFPLSLVALIFRALLAQ